MVVGGFSKLADMLYISTVEPFRAREELASQIQFTVSWNVVGDDIIIPL